MNNFEVIIGIENHVELKTQSKMFGSGPVSYGKEPNSQTSEVDLGYPGALPTVNKRGVELAILACHALKMQINQLLRFDRKNYFYPDLVKGFQITQQFHPIGKEGSLTINLPDGSTKEIAIERLHIEEDTAKQNHIGDLTYLDYNRSGVGLVEIVSKPVIHSADEAVEYVNTLREILLFLGVSDVKMNEGSLRCDVNISLRPYGFPGFGPKIEIKNLNSLSNVKKAIMFEIKRQSDLILNGVTIQQETRRFDENTQETVLMRVKSDAVDYKYFREPNINPIRLTDTWVQAVIKSAPELANAKRKRYLEDYKMKLDDANYILTSLELTEFFEATIVLGADPLKVVNYLISDVKALLNKENISIEQSHLQPQDLWEIIQLLDAGTISSKHVKTLLPIVFESDVPVQEVVETHNLKLISDVKTITELLKPIVAANNTLIVENFSTRPERVEKTLMGQLMKETGGNVNPDVAMQIISELIKKVTN